MSETHELLTDDTCYAKKHDIVKFIGVVGCVCVVVKQPNKNVFCSHFAGLDLCVLLGNCPKFFIDSQLEDVNDRLNYIKNSITKESIVTIKACSVENPGIKYTMNVKNLFFASSCDFYPVKKADITYDVLNSKWSFIEK
jgi:hypothetical protein